MGFFSSLKKNLTGSWADVDIRADDAERGGTLTATVTVRVRDDAIDVNKITVKLQCQEEIHIPDYRGGGTSRPAGSTGAAITRDRLDVRKTETLHTDEQTLAGAQQLSANSSHDFEATFRLPDHLPPTLEGRHAAFSWRVYASVDMKGNDPDSGWQEITVR